MSGKLSLPDEPRAVIIDMSGGWTALQAWRELPGGGTVSGRLHGYATDEGYTFGRQHRVPIVDLRPVDDVRAAINAAQLNGTDWYADRHERTLAMAEWLEQYRAMGARIERADLTLGRLPHDPDCPTCLTTPHRPATDRDEPPELRDDDPCGRCAHPATDHEDEPMSSHSCIRPDCACYAWREPTDPAEPTTATGCRACDAHPGRACADHACIPSDHEPNAAGTACRWCGLPAEPVGPEELEAAWAAELEARAR